MSCHCIYFGYRHLIFIGKGGGGGGWGSKNEYNNNIPGPNLILKRNVRMQE